MEISTRDGSAVKIAITLTNFLHTLKLARLFKSSQSITRASRDSRRIIKTHNSTKVSYSKTKIRKVNYTHNYAIMVISTRDVFAVITVIKVMRPLCFSNMTRLPKIKRSMTRRSGEHKQITQSCTSGKKAEQYCRSLGGNYTHNYPNVEISTRDHFAVITLIIEKISDGKLCRISKRGDRRKNRVNIYSGTNTNKGDNLGNIVNKKLAGQEHMTMHANLVTQFKYGNLATTSAQVGVCMNFNTFRWYGHCTKTVHKLRLHLCTEILVRKSRIITDGTFYFKAKKCEPTAYEIKVFNNITQVVQTIVDKTNESRRTMMVTPMVSSFTNKPLGGKDTTITKTRKIRTITIAKSGPKLGKVQCYTMSSQETARAVEQIQQAPRRTSGATSFH